jgi:hypothetical protein
MNLAMIYSELNDIGAPITEVFPASENTEGGILVDSRYLVQLSKRHHLPILLDIVSDNGQISEAAEFGSIQDLVQYIMEN